LGRASPQTYTISYHAYQNVTLDLRKTGKETNSYAMLTLDLYVYVVMVRVALLVLIGNMTVVLHGGLYIIYPPELSKSCTFDLIIHHLCSPGLQPGAFSLTLIFRFVNRTPVHITMHLTHALSALLFASAVSPSRFSTRRRRLCHANHSSLEPARFPPTNAQFHLLRGARTTLRAA